MNLITNRQLDRAQQQVIHELTLKKRQSKKSTMSEKHLLATQQLAHELLHERKVPILVESIRRTLHHLDSVASSASSALATPYTTSKTLYSSTSATKHIHQLQSRDPSHSDCHSLLFEQSYTCCNCSCRSSSSSHSTASSAANSNTCLANSATKDNTNNNAANAINRNHTIANHSPATVQPSVTSRLVTTASTSSGLSLTSSDASYSGSGSEASATNPMIEELDAADLEARRKQANIKFNQIRLEQLNTELETKLHQYEYLVAQEKALLGAYNMVLFTNEGVNNFQSKYF